VHQISQLLLANVETLVQHVVSYFTGVVRSRGFRRIPFISEPAVADMRV
jgi:hypothetical protein